MTKKPKNDYFILYFCCIAIKVTFTGVIFKTKKLRKMAKNDKSRAQRSKNENEQRRKLTKYCQNVEHKARPGFRDSHFSVLFRAKKSSTCTATADYFGIF